MGIEVDTKVNIKVATTTRPAITTAITTPIITFFNPIVFWAALMLAGPADLLLLFNLKKQFSLRKAARLRPQD